MDAQEFRTKAVTVLRGHTNELESMQTAIKRVVDAKEPAIPNQKDIFKEIADTAEECRQRSNTMTRKTQCQKKFRSRWRTLWKQ
jgi:hypothetical protein